MTKTEKKTRVLKLISALDKCAANPSLSGIQDVCRELRSMAEVWMEWVEDLPNPPTRKRK